MGEGDLAFTVKALTAQLVGKALSLCVQDDATNTTQGLRHSTLAMARENHLKLLNLMFKNQSSR